MIYACLFALFTKSIQLPHRIIIPFKWAWLKVIMSIFTAVPGLLWYQEIG